MSKVIADPKKAYELVPEVKACWRELVKSGKETIKYAMQIGDLLLKMKEILPHGEFQKTVEERFEFSLKTGQNYMKLAAGLPPILKRMGDEAVEDLSYRSGMKLIADSRPKPKAKRASHLPGNGTPAGTPGESSPPAESQDDRPAADYGKCPNCAGTKWTEDEFGVVCAKCNQPHGEALGDSDETGEESKAELVKTLRLKWIKTIEADIRAADDMNRYHAKPKEHNEAILLLKKVLRIAKEWME